MSEVTVLMAVYNGMPYLHKAIESILNQSYDDFEFLVVNDCSTDNSRDVILSYDDRRIRLIDNIENLNQTRSLNRGLKQIRTDLVARMDADDISHPRRLEKQVLFLNENPDIAAVGSNIRFIDPKEKITGYHCFPQKDISIRWMQLFDCPLSCGAVTFRRRVVWDQLGGFNPAIRFAQDWELWSRLLPKHKLANVSEYLLDVRLHPNASSSAFSKIMLEEQRRINRINPKRVLDITDTSEKWFKKLDTLLDKRVECPEARLEVIDTLFNRFCCLYPRNRQNWEILQILTRQYLEVLYYSDMQRLPKIIPIFGIHLYKSPVQPAMFIRECVSVIKKIPKHIKYWIGRNIYKLEI